MERLSATVSRISTRPSWANMRLSGTRPMRRNASRFPPGSRTLLKKSTRTISTFSARQPFLPWRDKVRWLTTISYAGASFVRAGQLGQFSRASGAPRSFLVLPPPTAWRAIPIRSRAVSPLQARQMPRPLPAPLARISAQLARHQSPRRQPSVSHRPTRERALPSRPPALPALLTACGAQHFRPTSHLSWRTHQLPSIPA